MFSRVRRDRVAAVGQAGNAELAQPLLGAGGVELDDEHVVRRVAGVATVEIAGRVAGDDDIARRVDRDAVGPLRPGRSELTGPEPRATRRVLHEDEILATRLRLARDRALGRERLVDVARGVDRDATRPLFAGRTGELAFIGVAGALSRNRKTNFAPSTNSGPQTSQSWPPSTTRSSAVTFGTRTAWLKNTWASKSRSCEASLGSGFLYSSSPTAMNIGSVRPVAENDGRTAG